jgi:hypothetical protein
LLTILHGWLRGARRNAKGVGIPFPEFESVTQKLRHAFFSIPAGNGLLTPCNDVVRRRPRTVYMKEGSKLYSALADARTLLRESTAAPTRCKELVGGWPDYVGVKDASKHGVGGYIVGEGRACTPTVFRMEWPDDIKNDLVTEHNPNGRITNSDLEMAGLLLLWLVMEAVCDMSATPRVALWSDNSPTVGWAQRLAAKGSKVAGQLIRALALRIKQCAAAPITPLHIEGKQNQMTDIPSRSFGSEAKWYCKTDDDLLTLFNNKFPLPNQASWTVFQPSSAICTRVISVLRMRVSTMEEWRRLPVSGKLIGNVGAPTAGLWDWTLTYRTSPTSTKCAPCQASPHERARDSTVKDAKSKVGQYLAHSRPLARRSQWPGE